MCDLIPLRDIIVELSQESRYKVSEISERVQLIEVYVATAALVDMTESL